MHSTCVLKIHLASTPNSLTAGTGTAGDVVSLYGQCLPGDSGSHLHTPGSPPGDSPRFPTAHILTREIWGEGMCILSSTSEAEAEPLRAPVRETPVFLTCGMPAQGSILKDLDHATAPGQAEEITKCSGEEGVGVNGQGNRAESTCSQ